ncbi:hypothetical protein LOTGIDRAFT_200147, partial [Lottia gigantea]
MIVDGTMTTSQRMVSLGDGTYTTEKSEDSPKRDKWGNHVEFFLATMGMAVGVGNIWRFPYICNINGGGAFLIPFVIFLVTCGLPLYLLEQSMGQFTGRSPVQSWEVCPLFKGVGYGMLVVCFTTTVHYNMIMAWTLYYLSQSFYTELPWTTCGNEWNTDKCTTLSGIKNKTEYNTSVSFNNGGNGTTSYLVQLNTSIHSKGSASAEEFWRYGILDISSGVTEIGGIKWQLIVVFIVAWIVVFLCMFKGIKSVGKVVYVTVLLPYVLLFILLIRGVTLKGSLDGILYFLKPDFNKLLEPKVWVQAAVQVFFSLGPCYGSLLTLSSHNPFHNNVLRDSIVLPLICEGTSLFGGIVIFSVLGFMAHEVGVGVGEVVDSGSPGLAFVVYPQGIGKIPIPQLWAVMFFLTLFSIGLDSQFCFIEAIFTGMLDTYPKFVAKRKVLLKVIFCVIYFLVGIPLCTRAGIYVYQLIDWYCVAISLFVFGLIECIVIGWIYGTERYENDIKSMIGRKPPAFFRIFWKYITPVILVAIMISTFFLYSPPSYAGYHYPRGAEIFGWIYASIPLIPVVFFMVKAIYSEKGSFLE